jgi:hypothetical protein
VRYYRRQDGTILLADCAVGVAAARKRKLIAASAAALLGGGVAYRITHRAPEVAVDAIELPTTESTETHFAGATQVEAPPHRPVRRVEPKPVREALGLEMGDLDF